MTIEEGKPAPLFTLQNQRAANVGLRDFRGKDVIVYFYPKDDTPGCTKEAKGFKDLCREIRAHGAEVIGISPDSVESHLKFAKKYGLQFNLLSDPDKKVMRKYGAFGEKVLYGKPVVGVIRSTVWIGADGKVVKHWRRVPKAADHPAKVLQLLKSR
ncbi:MAG: peroxiredoxin [Gemmatimonadales bacterium]